MMIGSRCPRIALGLAMGAIALALPVAAGAARVVVKETLTATAAAPPGASGRAMLVTTPGSKGKFMVHARGLEVRHAYDVVVDGAVVGSFDTNPRGAGHAIFRTGGGRGKAVKRKVLPLAFDPRGAGVAVRDRETGEDDLVGEMPGDGGDSSGGAFACCKPHGDDHDREVECEEKTPDDCVAAGGTPSSATSCFIDPDPCGVPPAVTVCCIPPGSAMPAFVNGDDGDGDDDDDHAQRVCVEGASGEECTAQGGKVVSAASCDPNPCGEDDQGDDGDDDHDCHDGDGDHSGDDGHGHGHGHGRGD
jgi:hypothetical protein